MELEVDDVRAWLLEFGEAEAAGLLVDAEFDYLYIDTAMRMDTEFGDIDIYELTVRLPGRLYRQLQDVYADATSKISEAIYELSQSSRGTHIRAVSWALRRPRIEEVESIADVPELDEPGLVDVHRMWTKAKARISADPDGAITASRTMLEALCKKVIEGRGDSYSFNDDMNALYAKASQLLSIAPRQQTEREYRKALGAVKTLVDSISCIRNREGDSHATRASASQLHARLVVNLSGSVASFLAGLLNAVDRSGKIKGAERR